MLLGWAREGGMHSHAESNETLIVVTVADGQAATTTTTNNFICRCMFSFLFFGNSGVVVA